MIRPCARRSLPALHAIPQDRLRPASSGQPSANMSSAFKRNSRALPRKAEASGLTDQCPPNGLRALTACARRRNRLGRAWRERIRQSCSVYPYRDLPIDPFRQTGRLCRGEKPPRPQSESSRASPRAREPNRTTRSIRSPYISSSAARRCLRTGSLHGRTIILARVSQTRQMIPSVRPLTEIASSLYSSQ
jgi:hypothetical protein